ncbi:MAG: FimV/HubP family polar landmark protein [Burkholderiaceae bacterium]
MTSIGRDELPTLQVRMAPIAAFRAANLDFNPALTNLRFALDKRPDGGYFVRISSAQPVNEPYLDLMVELTWATGRVIREYTVLLDPPSLRADAPVVAPAIPPLAAASTPAQPATTTRPSAAAPAASSTAPDSTPSAPATSSRPAPATTAPLATTRPEGSYVVKSGDTLGKIAARGKSASVSLDQMLVALLRANPDAFVGKNMNRLRAGATLSMPSEADAAGLAQREARREVVAQSADFAQYRSRLAQAAGSAPVVATAPSAAAGSGRVTTRVQDKAAPATTGGDQLKIARADSKAAASVAAAAKADEAAAKARALREEQERAAQLKKTNDAIQKALQVQSKAGAAAQKQADQTSSVTAMPTRPGVPPVAVAPPSPMPVPVPTPAPGVTTPTPMPVTPVSPSGTPPVTPTPIDASKSAPMTAVAPTTTPSPTAVVPAPAPVTPVTTVTTPPPAKKAAPPPPPPREEPSFFSELLSNTTTLIGLIGIVLLLAALFAWSQYRKRKAESSDRFKETGEGVQANSLFGATGGQSVDTGTSTFNSSFIPAASQLDSNEVDPVAEADVYIAYGREEQAEDILKEALRLQPDRHAVRVKLMEIYARRGDKTSFMAVAEELRERTGATGEDWERGVKLGRTVDPGHAMFAGAALGDTTRGPTTGFRLDPNTRSRPATLGGGATGGLDLGGLTGATSSVMSRDTTSASVPPLTKMVVDTRSGDSTMQVETKMPQDSRLAGPSTTSAPTTQFRATLPGAASPNTNAAAAATGASTDFGSLDFDLGPTRMGNLDVSTRMPDPDESPRRGNDAEVFAATTPQRAEPPAVADIDVALSKEKYPAMAPTATGVGAIPDLDLNIPPSTRMPVAPSTRMPVSASPMMEEALSRPTVIGMKATPVGSLPDEQAARLTANTDQATVPLIDFDLSAVSLDAATKRGETEPGSALAQQMATKLDLARGYIDLGVKDGARELLDEVMRDGTREQRQNAVDLIKQIES